jgi:hypothetical protein
VTLARPRAWWRLHAQHVVLPQLLAGPAVVNRLFEQVLLVAQLQVAFHRGAAGGQRRQLILVGVFQPQSPAGMQQVQLLIGVSLLPPSR